MPPRKLNIVESVEQQISNVFDPHVVGDVNESQVKVAKFGEMFDWHSHKNEDVGFFLLRGRIAIDFRDGTVELGEGDFIVVPRCELGRRRLQVLLRSYDRYNIPGCMYGAHQGLILGRSRPAAPGRSHCKSPLIDGCFVEW